MRSILDLSVRYGLRGLRKRRMRRNWYVVVQRAWAVSGVPATSDEGTWSQCQYQGCFSMVKGVSKLMELFVTFGCVCDKRKSKIEAVSSRSRGQVEDLLRCASRRGRCVFGVGRSLTPILWRRIRAN